MVPINMPKDRLNTDRVHRSSEKSFISWIKFGANCRFLLFFDSLLLPIIGTTDHCSNFQKSIYQIVTFYPKMFNVWNHYTQNQIGWISANKWCVLWKKNSQSRKYRRFYPINRIDCTRYAVPIHAKPNRCLWSTTTNVKIEIQIFILSVVRHSILSIFIILSLTNVHIYHKIPIESITLVICLDWKLCD